jgi:spore coat polysaccharide biosynthesis protein SpsF
MKVVAILQQRLGNTRCPGKGNLMLAGKTMDLNIVERVQRSKLIHQVVLACPPSDEDSFSYLPCRIHAPLVDENDLVGRYLVTAERCHADIVVRICCDNPCVEPEYIDKAIEYYLEHPVIFYSNAELTFVRNQWVDGLGCEVFSMSRLQWLDRMTTGIPKFREHPHKYFHENKVYLPWYLPYQPEDVLRLDVNTIDDYEYIRRIYDHFGNNTFHVNEVLAYLESKSAV